MPAPTTHSSLEGVNLTGDGLHLASVVIGLLLGHFQSLIVTRCRLAEVGKLEKVYIYIIQLEVMDL